MCVCSTYNSYYSQISHSNYSLLYWCQGSFAFFFCFVTEPETAQNEEMSQVKLGRLNLCPFPSPFQPQVAKVKEGI